MSDPNFEICLCAYRSTAWLLTHFPRFFVSSPKAAELYTHSFLVMPLSTPPLFLSFTRLGLFVCIRAPSSSVSKCRNGISGKIVSCLVRGFHVVGSSSHQQWLGREQNLTSTCSPTLSKLIPFEMPRYSISGHTSIFGERRAQETFSPSAIAVGSSWTISHMSMQRIS
jgi:hypothetical protein